MQFYFGWLKFLGGFRCPWRRSPRFARRSSRPSGPRRPPASGRDRDGVVLARVDADGAPSGTFASSTIEIFVFVVLPWKVRSELYQAKVAYMSRFRLSAAAFCVLIISTRFGSELERLKFDPLGSAGGGGGGGDFCEVLCELPELKDWFRLLLLAAGVWCAT